MPYAGIGKWSILQFFANIQFCGHLTAYFAAYCPQRTMILMI